MIPAPINTAKITLADGKERTLVFTHKAMKAMKERFGVSVTLQGTSKLFDALDETKVAELLMIGLRHKYEGGWPEVNESDLEELITGQNQLEVLNQIDAALGFSTIKNALELIGLLPGAALPILIATIKAGQAKSTPPAPAPVDQPPATLM